LTKAVCVIYAAGYREWLYEDVHQD